MDELKSTLEKIVEDVDKLKFFIHKKQRDQNLESLRVIITELLLQLKTTFKYITAYPEHNHFLFLIIQLINRELVNSKLSPIKYIHDLKIDDIIHELNFKTFV